MKIRAEVALDVTCLDADGNGAPDPAPGGDDYTDLMRSVGDGVRDSLKHGKGSEQDGFRHEWSYRTSVVVSPTVVVTRVPPPFKRPYNDLTSVATRQVMTAVVRMLVHMDGEEEVAHFLRELRDQLVHVEVHSRTGIIDQAIGNAKVGLEQYTAWRWFSPEGET
jgi:hypothetical protein